MGINVQISTRLQDYKKLWNVADPKETGATRARSTCQDPAPLNLNIFIIYRREKKGKKEWTSSLQQILLTQPDSKAWLAKLFLK